MKRETISPEVRRMADQIRKRVEKKRIRKEENKME
jgi:hypothetical protein